jgi:hypothetical protein
MKLGEKFAHRPKLWVDLCPTRPRINEWVPVIAVGNPMNDTPSYNSVVAIRQDRPHKQQQQTTNSISNSNNNIRGTNTTLIRGATKKKNWSAKKPNKGRDRSSACVSVGMVA